MIKKELIQIAKVLNQSKTAYALVGGLAVSTWVEPRSTKDIDLIVTEKIRTPEVCHNKFIWFC